MFIEQSMSYLKGYVSEPGIGPDSTKKGDPQRAALVQFLTDRFGPRYHPGELVIIDFGSGDGVLAREIDALLPINEEVPKYIAVDLPEVIEKLALPPRIHNKSSKLTIDEFYSRYLPTDGGKISFMVLRNLLHELDIYVTSNLFHHLLMHLGSNTEIYIQDMATIPVYERGNVGWDPNLLKEFLHNIGINASKASLESYGGYEWFILDATVSDKRVSLSVEQIEDFCAKARKKQQDSILEEIGKLDKVADDTSASKLIRLQGALSSISVQLMRWEQRVKQNGTPPPPPISKRLISKGIQLIYSEIGEYDFVKEIQEDVTESTGLISILSSKSLIDFPNLYRSSKHEALFYGYSLKHFLDDKNDDALEKALENGVKVKILLVHPESEAAIVRAHLPSYNSPEELIYQMRMTIEKVKRYNQNQQTGKEIELRLTNKAPTCSYFVIDNICYMSLYSNLATGSRCHCFIFEKTGGSSVGYYHFLLQDFNAEWEKGKSDEVNKCQK